MFILKAASLKSEVFSKDKTKVDRINNNNL